MFVGALVSWNHDRVNVSEFRVQYRIDNDNFETVQTASPSVTMRDLRAGTLKVQIQAKKLPKQAGITTNHCYDFELHRRQNCCTLITLTLT